MLRFFYTILLYLIQPIVIVFMFGRSVKAPNYRRRLNERYGFYCGLTPPKPNGIVIHAASVGEVIAATPLIKQIQLQYPDLPMTVTTVTPTGSDRVKAAFTETVSHVYLPYDLPDAVNRFINFIQPKVCIVIETEIWPNLIAQLKKRDIPFIIANARLSARSAKRYGWFKQSLHPVFNNISLIAAQDNVSGKRYLDLGYNPDRLKCTGNIKYDLSTNGDLLQKINILKTTWAKDRPVWIAASTHEGEEELILESHRLLLNKYPDLLLILVPRHPERFNTVAELIEKHKFRYIRRSANIAPETTTQVVLGDTMGELMLLYGISDIALVGGSLVKHGGHNPLEPLAFKLPVLSGKYTFNFPEVFTKLLQVQGALEVNENTKAITNAVEKFLDSPELRSRYGNAGYEVLIENRGALQRLLDLLAPYLSQ
ncbi:lipid IV(A) 3-deoxy-D-manno-octulosonic acid transferase [Pasteurella canis]|uniref:lipid IV(A) 3-deoxy-D-manno-octulosonic acid transferase n=1 Tax=Pasteurella canis TaxID=753 RepID=UPI001CC40865|nr:lipid IV(A) 3-deoxy-D-manno-octulosonic acid transferase [Pasteurella canis]UAY77591.1 lipid IV(A) 3-deoxy-D-manno-octulosonic acid transferase [Pasteurella canis]UEA16684.1 lipid IV(A) 3-deoxy-D-manno-octulosonic acid transferase [Pasteurella canis]GJJ81111.1 3-deoxy-D-manno-octulosonic acid transferase [Pasteurella canis]